MSAGLSRPASESLLPPREKREPDATRRNKRKTSTAARYNYDPPRDRHSPAAGRAHTAAGAAARARSLPPAGSVRCGEMPRCIILQILINNAAQSAVQIAGRALMKSQFCAARRPGLRCDANLSILAGIMAQTGRGCFGSLGFGVCSREGRLGCL